MSLNLKSIGFLVIFGLILIGYWAVPLSNPLFENDYSHVILDKDSQILRVFLNQKEQYIFPQEIQKKIPDRLIQSLIMFEDQYFYYHPGVNPFALVKAWFYNSQAKRILSGGSTISMQLARLSNPKSRTYFNKCLEIFQALKIELKYSKSEILSLYLNHAPFGGNIQGFYAASLLYFSKQPKNLTWAEAATLAVLPNNPKSISPILNQSSLIKKRNRLLLKLKNTNKLSENEYRLALKETLHQKLQSFPFIAAHFSEFVINKAAPGQFLHHTSLDKELQKGIKAIAKRSSRGLSWQGIDNIAILVSDTKSGEILAYVGSQDYFDHQNSGSVDGIHAWRSSASTLKPFLYALAIDEGIALPDTKLFDIPTNISGFSPANASQSYYGVVSLKQALIESLNVPATRVLNTMGVERFYIFLKSAGLSTLFRPAEDYGLALILGGAETNLWDLSTLYRALGNQGQFSELSYLKSKKENPKPQFLISPGASYLILNSLKELVRPGTEHFWDIYSNQWPIAWKTGTSYGQRDAWAVGVSPQYTIAVWVGNFSGVGNANLSGTISAGPVLFDVFNYLPKTSHKRWFSQPNQALKKILTCSESGLTAGAYCEISIQKKAPQTMPALQVCPYHHRLHLNLTGTYQVCSKCWSHGKVKKVNRLIYPPQVRKILFENAVILPKIPIHNPKHPGVYSLNENMTWIYPKSDSKIWIPRGLDGNYERVACKLAHINPNSEVFWYVNDHFVGKTKNYHELALLFQNGKNTLIAIDEQGQQIKQSFQVALKPVK